MRIPEKRHRNLRAIAAAVIAPVLAVPVAFFIWYWQRTLARIGAPLPTDLHDAMAAYFSEDLLRSTVLVQRAPLPLVPGFAVRLASAWGFAFASPSAVAGITFGNVVATTLPPDAPLLFHELVHVAQYRLLGIFHFSRLYVQGFLAEGSYRAIPLECCAYNLEDRYRFRPLPYNVEMEVAEWLDGNRF